MSTHLASGHPQKSTSPDRLVIEIRAGVGGEEAALFALQLQRMYTRFALRAGWKTELVAFTPFGAGARDIVLRLTGVDAARRLATEPGIHCIQRISPTDRRRRVHTSTATVAVMRELEPAEMRLRDEDVRIETMRSRGHGGQGVNTTDSAVRVTHLPTGLTATCQDERSQHRNRERALAVLRARVYAAQQSADTKQRHTDRARQIGRGERAERMRTYDMPEDRLIDRRQGKKLRGVERILNGDLADVLAA